MKPVPFKSTVALLLTLLLSGALRAQIADPDIPARAIQFPDIPGFVTLKCDLHMHSVLSDGSVWPNIRVEEALRNGLDAISITDHIEYQHHIADIPHPDRNRSYELARRAAEGTGLMVIPGTEITRSMPPGHFNAIFIKDVNKLNQEDVMEVFREARKQGAFVFWNHPHWTAQRPDGVATLTDMHRELLKEGLFSGIEVYNEDTYSKEAFKLAQEYNLTLLGNSDVHGLVDWSYQVPDGGHRPVTLVFAKEKTPEAMQKALENRQTVVWFDNNLVGNPDFLVPLITESLEVQKEGRGPVPSVLIHNRSDADFVVENQSDYSLHNFAPVFILKAHETTKVMVKTLEELDTFDLKFKVLNAFSSPAEQADIQLRVE
jgi:3',5'-nucleoside bisphosphate phosphatase